jgi:hypothetical protein
MDIAILSESTLKLKAKKTTLAIDPKTSVAKFDADAILMLDRDGSDPSRVSNSRVVINQVGEYEISGLKIVGLRSDEDVMYRLVSDNTSIFVAKASSLDKISADKIGDYQIVIINVDEDLNQSLITAMEPRVIIFYGAKAKEAAKAVGKENVLVSPKISLNEDKLPEEMTVYVLA